MSEFRFKCPHCDKSLRQLETNVGRRVRCPKCHAVLVIPSPKAHVAVGVTIGGSGDSGNHGHSSSSSTAAQAMFGSGSCIAQPALQGSGISPSQNADTLEAMMAQTETESAQLRSIRAAVQRADQGGVASPQATAQARSSGDASVAAHFPSRATKVFPRGRRPVDLSLDGARIGQDRFYLRTQNHWYLLIALAGAGLLIMGLGSRVLGVVNMSQANTASTSALVFLLGLTVLLLAALPALLIFAKREPAIRCFYQGVECKLSDQMSDEEILPAFFPKRLQSAAKWIVTLTTLSAFRTQTYRINWFDFQNVEMDGYASMYMLTLRGRSILKGSDQEKSALTFSQQSLKMNPELIHYTLTGLAQNEKFREQLPGWDEA